MHIPFPARILAAMASILIMTGCASAPKPVSHEVSTKRPYWKYRYLDGKGSADSPEADKLRQTGWIFVGYIVSHGDTIAIDEDSEVARRMYYGVVPRDVIKAKFKRECE